MKAALPRSGTKSQQFPSPKCRESYKQRECRESYKQRECRALCECEFHVKALTETASIKYCFPAPHWHKCLHYRRFNTSLINNHWSLRLSTPDVSLNTDNNLIREFYPNPGVKHDKWGPTSTSPDEKTESQRFETAKHWENSVYLLLEHVC